MHRRVIYQALAWAPPIVVIAVSAFVSPASTQLIKRTIVYEENAYAPFTPAAAEVVTVDKWFAQLANPVRRKTVTAEEGSIFPAVALQANDAIGWHKPWDEPQRLKRIARGTYQFEAPAPFPQVPWGWYEQLDRTHPVKRVPVGQVSLQFVAAAPGAAVAQNWWQQLDTPTRGRRLYEFPATATAPFVAPPPLNEINWWPALDTPVRRKTITAEEGSIFAAPPPPIVAWGWYEQLDHRHPQKRVAIGQVSLQFVASAPGSAVAQNWFHQLDTPTRLRKLYEFPATSIPVFFAPTGVGFELNWWPALNEPVRPRLSIRSAQQQGLTAPSQLITATLENAWFQRLNEPVRLKATFGQYPGWTAGNVPIVPLAWSSIDEPRRFRRVTRVDQADSYFPVVVAETITIDKWWRELVRPTTLRARPHQQGYTFVAAAPGAGATYNWFQSLDTPTRLRKSRQSDAAYGNFVPAVANLTAIPTSRQIINRTIIFEERAYTTFIPATPGAGTEYNWFQPLDTPPVRRRKSTQFDPSRNYQPGFAGPGVAYNWFQPLDIPTRRRKSCIIYQKPTGYGDFTPPLVLYAATSTSAQILQRAILFDHTATPPVGIALPTLFQQTVTINITVAFNRMLRYSCKAEEADASSTQAEGSSSWVTQAEVTDTSSIQSEASDPWSTQVEDVEDWDDEDQTPESGCP